MDLNEHEQACFDAADHFTAARGRGAKRTVERCANLKAVKAYADKQGDGRTMIYAVTAAGRVAHIMNA